MPLGRLFEPAQPGFDLGFSLLMGPAGIRLLPEHILDIDARAAFDEQTGQFQIASERSPGEAVCKGSACQRRL
jgi:hypothetical protein